MEGGSACEKCLKIDLNTIWWESLHMGDKEEAIHDKADAQHAWEAN